MAVDEYVQQEYKPTKKKTPSDEDKRLVFVFSFLFNIYILGNFFVLCTCLIV